MISERKLKCKKQAQRQWNIKYALIRELLWIDVFNRSDQITKAIYYALIFSWTILILLENVFLSRQI